MSKLFGYDRTLSTKELRALAEQWNPKIKPCKYGGFYVFQPMKSHGPIYYLNMPEENVFFWAMTLEWDNRFTGYFRTESDAKIALLGSFLDD